MEERLLGATVFPVGVLSGWPSGSRGLRSARLLPQAPAPMFRSLPDSAGPSQARCCWVLAVLRALCSCAVACCGMLVW